MNQIIMAVFAAGAVLGGFDYICHNRLGYGEKFEEGFLLLGQTALSMAGIICLTPALSRLLGALLSPALRMIGIDPAIAAALFPIDMGGYPLAMQLADDPAWGRYSGIVLSAIFGCTLLFTLPVGMRVIREEDSGCFLLGTTVGMAVMPVGFLVGGLLSGFSLPALLFQLLPLFFCALLLILGLWKLPGQMLRLFRLFVSLLRSLITFGLICGAFCHMLGLRTGWLTPLAQAMETVSSICIVMLGSLPVSLLLQRILRKPLHALGRRIGLDDVAVTALLIGTVSVIPALTMLRDTDRRGKTAVCAYLVSAASLMGAHIAFAAGASPEMTGALIAAKLTGALAALFAALFIPLKRTD